MRFVIQRVQHASCEVEGNITGEIGKGFLVLIGVSDTDTKEIADKMVKKLLGMTMDLQQTLERSQSSFVLLLRKIWFMTVYNHASVA